MNVFESAEDYLERILMLSEKKQYIRAIDIANDMNFSKASVSIALKKLRDKEYVVVDETNGSIHLTEEGKKIALKIYNRHKVLTEFFGYIGVSEKVAKEDACKIEHDLSDETMDRIEDFIKNKK